MAELSLPWTAKNEKGTEKKQIRIAYEKDLAESIWTKTDRIFLPEK